MVLCGSCGKEAGTKKFCWACGAQVNQVPPPPEEPASPKSRPTLAVDSPPSSPPTRPARPGVVPQLTLATTPKNMPPPESPSVGSVADLPKSGILPNDLRKVQLRSTPPPASRAVLASSPPPEGDSKADAEAEARAVKEARDREAARKAAPLDAQRVTCNECGANTPLKAFCFRCGAKLTQGRKNSSGVPPPPSSGVLSVSAPAPASSLPSSPVVDPKKCVTCGKLTPEGKKFCIFCGTVRNSTSATVEPPTSPAAGKQVNCANCGASNPMSKKYCFSCGQAMAAENSSRPSANMSSTAYSASFPPPSSTKPVLTSQKSLTKVTQLAGKPPEDEGGPMFDPRMGSPGKEPDPDSPEYPKHLLMKELKINGNNLCVDCEAPNPDWASINLGVFMCLSCSGIHRQLGTHISQVRSVDLDKWMMDWVEVMQNGGNKKLNAELERYIPKTSKKPRPGSSMAIRNEFIFAKYKDKQFTGEPPDDYDPKSVYDTAASASATAGENSANKPSRRLSDIIAEQEAIKKGLVPDSHKKDKTKGKGLLVDNAIRGKKNLTRAKQWAREKARGGNSELSEKPEVTRLRFRVRLIHQGWNTFNEFTSPLFAMNQKKVRPQGFGSDASAGSCMSMGSSSNAKEEKGDKKERYKPFLPKMISAGMAASTRMNNLAKMIHDVEKMYVKTCKLRLTSAAAAERLESAPESMKPEERQLIKEKAELRKKQWEDLSLVFIEKATSLENEAEATFTQVLEGSRIMLRSLLPGWK